MDSETALRYAIPVRRWGPPRAMLPASPMPMFMSKYQRFVAGRYLLERNQNLSSAILVVVAVCLWVAAGMGAACLWYPLADISKVPPPNPPVWVVVALGLSMALPMVALLAAAVLSIQGRSCRAPLYLGLQGGLVALTSFGLYHKGATELALSTADVWVGALLVHMAFVGPALWSVLSSWYRQRQASGALLFVALVASPPAALLWLIFGRLLHKRYTQSLLSFAFALQLVVVQLLLVGAAYQGARAVAWPNLFPETGSSLWAQASFVALGCALAAGVMLAVLRQAPRRRSEVATLALASLLVAMLCAIIPSFLVGVENVRVNLDFLGGWASYTPPMNLIIPALVAGAIAILSLVLLAVRFSFSFFTTVSIGGVTIGTMALVIVLSVMSGFETDLREKILGFNAHIQISHSEELQFSGYRKVEKILEKTDGVAGYTPFLMTEAYMSNHNNYGNVTLKGIDPARVASVTEIVHNLVAGDERALEKIWPLNEDGSIAGAPSEIADDEAEFELDGPVDFSGGVESGEDLYEGDKALDEQSEGDESGNEEEGVREEASHGDDFDLGPPTDFSGGLEEYVDEPEVGLDADAIADDAGPPSNFVAGDDWDMELPEHDFMRPEVAVLDGLLVGQELVNQISLYTDQEIRIISPLPDTSPDGLSIPRLQNFRIAGKFFSGMYEYDLKYVYCSLSALQNFLDLGDEVNGIEVRVNDPTQTGAIVRKLERALGPNYRVQDWKELNKALFSALKLEKIAMFFILVIIVLVASFSIVGNLIMVVIEKAKEIAILKTLGSSNRAVMSIFITQGFFIGLAGTSLGVALGLGACYLGKTYGVPLDPDVYYIDKLPIQVEPWSIVIVGFAGVAISVVATIYPAFIAARMRPVKGLRWD